MAGIIALLLNVAAVLFMSGNIWVRQIVYYPLYAFVGVEAFPAYQRENARRVERIIQPAHAAMALSSVLLLFVRPARVPLAWAALGVVLQVVAAAATVYEVPRQLRLARGFDSHIHHELLAGNWARTVAITIHGALVLWMLWLVTSPAR
jgi:hypothetical protein